MVVLDTDLAVGAEVDTLRVVVTREGGEAPSHDVLYDLRSGRFTFPGTLAVVARDAEDLTPLRVSVTVSRAGVTRFVHVASAAPRPNELARLEVFLARRCLDAASAQCGAGSTCGRAGCEPIARGTLPTYNP